jgi:glycerol-3-phosphate dehydrogenase subunit B
LASLLKEQVRDSEIVLMPACLGLERTDTAEALSDVLQIPVKFLPIFPPSISGIRAQYLLKQRFMELGGTYMLGDTVNKVDFDDNRVNKIYTVNHGDIPLRGNEYVLCSGSFFSQGLMALPNDVIDPVCGLDIDYVPDRKQWFSEKMFDKQRFESFGIKTNSKFQAIKGGIAIENMHVCGASLGGFDALKEGCGGGVSLLTALYVANEIIEKEE